MSVDLSILGPDVTLHSNIQSTQSDTLLYIGLTVAIFLVCLLSFFVIRLYRKKGQHQSLYNMAASADVLHA
ncbi:hypothetical protein YQE_04008, partial [Dendroctonus ponderosae]